jgi:hypothetical protein
MGEHIQTLVLQEFELRSADADGSVARLIASSSTGRQRPVPLLTSIDDERRVAMVRAFDKGESLDPSPAERAALAPFVSTWRMPRHYRPRIIERSQSPPSYYRLAVTESGINQTALAAPAEAPRTEPSAGGTTSLDLLWIGAPVDSYAGLLVLLGSSGRGANRADAHDWPLPLSDALGVRIYEGVAPKMM